MCIYYLQYKWMHVQARVYTICVLGTGTNNYQYLVPCSYQTFNLVTIITLATCAEMELFPYYSLTLSSKLTFVSF